MKIISTIEARMGSIRLSRKVMKKILDKPLLELLIERLKRAKRINEIVIATTTKPEDIIIAKLAAEIGVECFRGSSEDVLNRVLQATKAFHGDVIVETTGDCPLLDPVIIDEIIKTYLENSYDFVANTIEETYPRGLDAKVFSVNLLEEVSRLTNDPADREHVSLYIYEHPEKYKLYNIEAPPEHHHPEYRWTVDTEEDLKFVRAVYKNLYSKNPNFLTGDIMKLLEEQPDLCKINANVEQKPVR